MLAQNLKPCSKKIKMSLIIKPFCKVLSMYDSRELRLKLKYFLSNSPD